MQPLIFLRVCLRYLAGLLTILTFKSYFSRILFILRLQLSLIKSKSKIVEFFFFHLFSIGILKWQFILAYFFNLVTAALMRLGLEHLFLDSSCSWGRNSFWHDWGRNNHVWGCLGMAKLFRTRTILLCSGLFLSSCLRSLGVFLFSLKWIRFYRLRR